MEIHFSNRSQLKSINGKSDSLYNDIKETTEKNLCLLAGYKGYQLQIEKTSTTCLLLVDIYYVYNDDLFDKVSLPIVFTSGFWIKGKDEYADLTKYFSSSITIFSLGSAYDGQDLFEDCEILGRKVPEGKKLSDEVIKFKKIQHHEYSNTFIYRFSTNFYKRAY
jgi:hypothetical protein